MQEIKRFILQQKEIIIFYKKATGPNKEEGSKEKKEKLVEKINIVTKPERILNAS